MNITMLLLVALVVLVLISNFTNRSVRGWMLAVAIALGMVIGVRFLLFSLKVVLTLTQWIIVVILIAAIVFAIYGWYTMRQSKEKVSETDEYENRSK